MANAIKLNEGTVKVFAASGGDATWTPTSVANGAGRLSAQLDLGAAPRAKRYRWVLVAKMVATPTAGASLRPYLVLASTAATTYQDGLAGVSDAAVATETVYIYQARLLQSCLTLAATTSQVWSGYTLIVPRYVSFMLWNASGAALSGTAADCLFRLEPVYDEVQ